MRRAGLAIVLAFPVCVLLESQTEPRFEVVSIKPTPDPPVGTGMFPKPGLLTIRNYTLKRLVGETYRVKPFQLHGGPAWSDTEHYDIVGKASGNANFSAMLEMVIPMMQERFQLQVHRETRELPVYALVPAKNGPKMTLAADQSKDGAHRSGSGLIDSRGLSMQMFANILAGHLDRPVMDQTGLSGIFVFTLRFDADQVRVQQSDPATPDAPSPSLFQAIQEQLGLKLENRRAPVETIAIDHAERPTAN
jgi:uncharacterized protein (TIGR03435 family)